MGATWQRYNEMPEAERVVDPASALTGLARALIQMIGVLAPRRRARTGRFAYPAALASELSRLCHEAGDIAVWIV